MWEKEFTILVQDQYKIMRAKNPRFSIRAFGKRLGMSSGGISDIINRKNNWRLKPARAASILDKLDLDVETKNQFLVKMGLPPQHVRKDVSEQDYEILLDSTYYPILFSFDLPKPLCEPDVTARRLGLSIEKVNSVIDDLIRRGFLERTEGEIKRPKVFWGTSTDGPPNDVLKKYHLANLESAKRAITELPAALRDLTAITFAGDEAQIASMKLEIRKFYDRASSIMNGGQKNNRVFRLSVQLFPMEVE